MNNRQRELLALRYLSALEHGALDVLADILEQAETDAALETMIREIHAEDRLPVFVARPSAHAHPAASKNGTHHYQQEKTMTVSVLTQKRSMALPWTLVATVGVVILGLLALIVGGGSDPGPAATSALVFQATSTPVPANDPGAVTPPPVGEAVEKSTLTLPVETEQVNLVVDGWVGSIQIEASADAADAITIDVIKHAWNHDEEQAASLFAALDVSAVREGDDYRVKVKADETALLVGNHACLNIDWTDLPPMPQILPMVPAPDENPLAVPDNPAERETPSTEPIEGDDEPPMPSEPLLVLPDGVVLPDLSVLENLPTDLLHNVTVGCGGASVDLLITVPETVNVEVTSQVGEVQLVGVTAPDDISLKTELGAISVENVTAHGALTAETKLGDVSLLNTTVGADLNLDIEAGQLTLNTVTTTGPITLDLEAGSVKGNHLSGGSLQLEVEMGEVVLDDVKNSSGITVDVELGSITFDGLIAGTGAYEFKTAAGAINVTAQAGSAFSFEASAEVGNVTVDLAGVEPRIERDIISVSASGTYNPANAEAAALTLSTDAGEISLHD
ncbi:MAG: DUF4097 family beta strand repeat protein, partial [Chloroflexi bacterium]|nr:DUF4097 family beta strand repeat protein [Chloroflexota bacterium]